MVLASLAFQQDVNGYRDTIDTLIGVTNPDADESATVILSVDGRPSSQVLLRFDDIIGDDPGQIPAGSTITSATLELQVSDQGTPLALHRMLQEWSDKDSWDSLDNGVQPNGVEAVTDPDVTTRFVDDGLVQIDVIHSLQAWTNNPSANRGWALIPTGDNGIDFDSAEGATPPRLVVSYEPESRPLITIEATDGSSSETGPDRGIFTVTRSNVTSGDLTVAYSIGGTATNGEDYRSLSGSVVFPNGVISVDLVVDPIDDSDAEGGETVIATITPSAEYYIGASFRDTITIADEDAVLTVSITVPSISEAGGATTATVSRNSDTTDALVVKIDSDGFTEASIPTTVTIPAGQTTSLPFNITSMDDRLSDGDQVVTITAIATGYISDTETLLVTDNEVVGVHQSCFTDPDPRVSFNGPQPSLEIEEVATGTTLDASNASWYATSKTRVEVENGVNVCWHGGLVEHNWPADQDWETTHRDHGFKFRNTPNLIVEHVQIINAGDGISLYEGTEDFLIRGAYFEDIRDDAVEHDWLGNGIIEDTFINGAYVAYAARSRDSVDIDGSENTWVIKDTLTFIRPQIGVYKGPSPGYGRFFKWEDVAPKLEIHNSIFRADEIPDYDYLGIPEGKLVSSSNNIVVWNGEGEVPPLPDGFTLTQDMSIWENAVRQWKIKHGFPLEDGDYGPPVLAPIGDQSVDEASLLTFTASATDGNPPTDNLTFSLDSGAPPGATIDPVSGHFRWTPAAGTSVGAHTVTVRVTDGGIPRIDDFETITITVNDVNLPPILAAIGDKNIQEGSTLTFAASATDADLPANDLAFSLEPGAPVTATIDPNTGQFSWTPDESDGPGVFSVTVRVTDNQTPSMQDSETFDIIVGEVNQAPRLANIGNQTVDEADLLTFTASATDDDLPANNLTFSLDSDAPSGATIDAITGQFRWTPPGGSSPGDHLVTVRVTDDGQPHFSDAETITITVNDVNLPPVLAPINSQSVDEGNTLTVTVSATDDDLPANRLIYSLDPGAPLNATIDSNSGEFNWTPGETHGGATFSVTVRVTERGVDGLEDFETFEIRVVDINRAPLLAPIGDKKVDEGNLLTFTARAVDGDLPPNNLTFSLDLGAPSGATIDPVTGRFQWIPDEADGAGKYPVTIRVVDDGAPSLYDFETILITINEVNRNPVLAEISDKSVFEGSLLTFTAVATDVDLPANNLTFSLDTAPDGATIDPRTGQFLWIPNESDGPGAYFVTVRVVDDGTANLEDIVSFNITVGEVNRAPVLMPIGAKQVDEGSLLAFIASATDDDLPVNNLSFSLDPGAPPGATIHPNTGQFRWTPPEGTPPGDHTVTIRINDKGQPPLEDFETIKITVTDVNLPPVLDPIGTKTIYEGQPLSFTASATDADLPTNNLVFSLDPGAPLGASIHPSTGEFQWTPSETHGSSVFSLTVRVTDDQTPSLDDFETFDIMVTEVNQAPALGNISEKSIAEGTLLVFTAAAIDDDLPENKLTFSLDSGAPVGATIDPSTGQFQWMPDETHGPGVFPVTVRVIDDGTPSLNDSQSLNIFVSEVNQAPVLTAIGTQNVYEGNQLTFTASATDADLPANNLIYSLEPGAPVGATIDPTTGQFRWTPGESDGPDVHSVTIRVTDDGNIRRSDLATFDIVVDEINRNPVLATIGNNNVDEGSLLTFTASATDTDVPANKLTFSLDPGAPVGATIDSDTGQFRWTPAGGTSPGTHTITVRVTDHGLPRLNDRETITITVNDVNLQPVLAPIGTQSVEEGNTLTFTASATDADLPANNLTYSLDGGAPLGASIDPITGLFTWTPGESHGSAAFSVTVRVSDNESPAKEDFETFDILVVDVNQAPLLVPLGNKRIDEGDILTFVASAIDHDLPVDKLTFSLDSNAPVGATIDPRTGQFRWMTPAGTSPGDHSVTVRVTDNGVPQLDDSQTITITVNDINLPPVLAPMVSQIIEEGMPLSFFASATDGDLPADNLTFHLEPGAPLSATIDPITGQFRWTPGETHGDAVFTVTVRVTDNQTPSLQDYQTFDISVIDTNQAPVLAPIGSKSINDGELLAFTAWAIDGDLPADNLTFSLGADAPDGATIDARTGQFRWTPPIGTLSGNYKVTIRVTDDGTPSLEAFDTANILVFGAPITRNPLDVNRDQAVTVLDALAIINQINRAANSDGKSISDYDTNHDGKISILDALLVINHIGMNQLEAESTSHLAVPDLNTNNSDSKSPLDDDLIRMLAEDATYQRQYSPA